jgi:hypothetical protein
MDFKSIIISFADQSFWKGLIAALFGLFHVPTEFLLAIPTFWFLDFLSGLYRTRKRKEGFKASTFNRQYAKFLVHGVFLIGCAVIANLYSAPIFIEFGFGYIIITEFISITTNLFGEKEAAVILGHLKSVFYKKVEFKIHEKEEEIENK